MKNRVKRKKEKKREKKLCTSYVLAFLATNAPPHRPAHHAKPFNANVINHAAPQINAKIRSDTAATTAPATTAAVRPTSMSAGSSSSLNRAQRTAATKAPSVPLRHSQSGQASK